MWGTIACVPRFGYSTTRGLSKNNRRTLGGDMKNPLDSLWGTVISGLVITLILYNIVKFALQ
jgi:hypothetical protein